MMTGYIDNCVEKLTKIPYPLVPHDPESFLRTQSRLKLVKKYLHRDLALRLGGQSKREIRRIEKGMRVLWLYTGKANFGDAIMEMSGRALLPGADFSVDLLTLPKLHPLFCEDDIFENVYSHVDALEGRRYDAVVLNEFNYPSIELKKRHFRKTPFACLFQYFHGPARNQTLFSFAAVNDVFGIGLRDDALIQIAKPYLQCNDATRRAVSGKRPEHTAMALSVGGIDQNRSYRHWPSLLAMLDAMDDDRVPRQIVLLGSDNGLQMADEIMRKTFRRLEVVSHVARLSLLEAREIIGGCRLFVGCDGGLMHVAHSTETPSVTIFSHREPMRFFLTRRCHSLGLQSPGGASEVPPDAIADAVLRQLGVTASLSADAVQAR
ncbi:heptosyltransferase [Trinickia symbiotica]|uniref:Heptosyltransferase n=1 Tax=Trinickia symbiotica TaxID=863227 RepID=A0A2T3XSB4_9BURK|nr:glycosyltransferase family 9 protein [Trinickia symbiotica]PTB19385.1 heptosyltransferase [Trinickia symbiotica]